MVATFNTTLQSNHLGEMITSAGIHSGQTMRSLREQYTNIVKGKGMKKHKPTPSVDVVEAPALVPVPSSAKVLPREDQTSRHTVPIPLDMRAASMSRASNSYTSTSMAQTPSMMSTRSHSRRASCPDTTDITYMRREPTQMRGRSHSMAAEPSASDNVVFLTADSKTFSPQHRTPTVGLKSCLSPNVTRGRQTQRGASEAQEGKHDDASQIAHACAKAVEDRVLAEEQAEVAWQMIAHVKQGVSKGTWSREELRQAEAVWSAATEKVDDAVTKEMVYNDLRRGTRASSRARRLP